MVHTGKKDKDSGMGWIVYHSAGAHNRGRPVQKEQIKGKFLLDEHPGQEVTMESGDVFST